MIGENIWGKNNLGLISRLWQLQCIVFLTCCVTYWTSCCLKESHHLTHRGRTCPFALLGRAKCLFLQVKCYSVLFCARSSCYAQKGKKGESYVSSARAVHSFHTVQISAVSKRLLFARKLSIFETQHLSYLLLVLCMKHVLARPSRAKGTTQQAEDERGDLRGLTTERDSHSATLRRPGLICHHQRWG